MGIVVVGTTGLKTKDNRYIVNPGPEVKIPSYDPLFVPGKTSQLNKLRDILTGKTQIPDEDSTDGR